LLFGKYGVAACAAVAALYYFLSIRFVDLWPFALFAPLPRVAEGCHAH